uniref:DNA-directed DNA polymerase n=1 Tax=Tanacetum cinerariifolium TaxID=118510 RepID=A0A699GGP4_TANCI|nr:DNA-directed DNA polymerase [Tanacetum cinerariifolium]
MHFLSATTAGTPPSSPRHNQHHRHHLHDTNFITTITAATHQQHNVTATTATAAQPHSEPSYHHHHFTLHVFELDGCTFCKINNKFRVCMRTHSSSNLPNESSPNLTTSNLSHRNRRRSKQPFILEESPIDTMADQRTMAELLRVPTKGQPVGGSKKNPRVLFSLGRILFPNSLMNYFPLRTTNLRNEISNFQQRSDESFHKTWDRYKDLLRACPHHGFTELHQLDTFYNALNPTDQDSLNSAAGGNLDANSSSSEIAKLTHAVNQQTSALTTAMIAIFKQFQSTPPPAFVKAVEEICVTCGGAHPYYQCLAAGGNTFLKLRDNIQGYVAAAAVNYNQGSRHLPSNTIANPKGELKSITTQSGIVLDGPFVPIPLSFINPEEDKRVEETLTGQYLAEYTIKVPPPLKMLKALLSNKEKLLELVNTPFNENCSAVILKKLPEKLGDPRKVLILCGFSLPELISTRMTLELTNRAICTPARIARDVFVSVGKFTFPANFVIVDYESDPRFPLILGRPFLRTAHALIDVHREEMILCDEGGNVLPEKFLDIDSTKDLHPPHNVNPLSDSTTSSSSPNNLLEEFADKLALITFPSEYDDDLPFDIEYDLKEIEYLLNHDPIKDMDSILKDLVDQSNLADLNDNLVDTVPEMFTDEHALDYSSPLLYDEYDDDLFESKLLIDELDLPGDFIPSSEYDVFLFEDFSKVDALSSTNNEDKVFNPGIPIQENLFEVITHVTPDKKLAISHASLILEDFNPPLYELPFFKEVPRTISSRL